MKVDWLAVLRGAGVAAAGALLTYLSEFVMRTDFGQFTPLVVSAFSVLANIIRKQLGLDALIAKAVGK